MRWSTVILPRQEGGLGIIDPEIQSRALITKLVVRGLYPGNEPWKSFLQSTVIECSPCGRAILQIYFLRGSPSVFSFAFYAVLVMDLVCDAPQSHSASSPLG